jgi:hypothetical protein
MKTKLTAKEKRIIASHTFKLITDMDRRSNEEFHVEKRKGSFDEFTDSNPAVIVFGGFATFLIAISIFF